VAGERRQLAPFRRRDGRVDERRLPDPRRPLDDEQPPAAGAGGLERASSIAASSRSSTRGRPCVC
jgi:hypothetical protein